MFFFVQWATMDPLPLPSQEACGCLGFLSILDARHHMFNFWVSYGIYMYLYI